MRHPFHLVERSPWPILLSLNLFFLLIGMVSILNGYLYSKYTLLIGFFILLLILTNWLYDIISESLYIGAHTYKTLKSLIIAFLYFVLTEVMLFFSLFWSYFHSGLNPSFLIWPPIGIDLINPFCVPLLNTFLLFYSGVLCTVAHHLFIAKSKNNTIVYLFSGILLGILFLILQIFEYSTSAFDITDSVYGSSFFMLTGLHGFHICTGLLFLLLILYRIYSNHTLNIIFDLALLYYHFLDLIWILLFILIYYLAY